MPPMKGVCNCHSGIVEKIDNIESKAVEVANRADKINDRIWMLAVILIGQTISFITMIILR